MIVGRAAACQGFFLQGSGEGPVSAGGGTPDRLRPRALRRYLNCLTAGRLRPGASGMTDEKTARRCWGRMRASLVAAYSAAALLIVVLIRNGDSDLILAKAKAWWPE